MAETMKTLSQEQLVFLNNQLVNSFNFPSTLTSISKDLADMQDTIRLLKASNSAFYPVLQDLVIDFETAQEAITDALKCLNDLGKEIKK